MSYWDAAHQLTQRLSRWLGGLEPVVLVMILVIVAATWSFIALADEVAEGGTLHFDERMVLSMRTEEDRSMPIGPAWLQETSRDATALGGYGWLIFFTLATAGYLWLDGKRHLTRFLLASAVSGYVVCSLLKFSFQRPRPEIVPHLSHVYGSTSFPSGHSMNAAVIYLTLGTIVATAVSQRRLKVYVLMLATFITAVVGISRVYLGVHYPTDVLAGWMAGLIWALLCWLVAHQLQRSGTVEKPTHVSHDDTNKSII